MAAVLMADAGVSGSSTGTLGRRAWQSLAGDEREDDNCSGVTAWMGADTVSSHHGEEDDVAFGWSSGVAMPNSVSAVVTGSIP